MTFRTVCQPPTFNFRTNGAGGQFKLGEWAGELLKKVKVRTLRCIPDHHPGYMKPFLSFMQHVGGPCVSRLSSFLNSPRKFK